MNILNFWQISAWAIAIGLSIAIYFELRSSCINQQSLQIRPSIFEIMLAITLTSMGLILRFAFLDEFQAGRLTSDEHRLANIYISTIVHNELARGGATHLAFARSLDFWYQTVGFTPLLARSFSAFLGAVSLVFFFFGLRKVAGVRLAMWGTAFLSISLFGIYFSKLAIETGWAIFIPPVVFYFLVVGGKFKFLAVAASGFFLSLGLFSYPGLLMAIIAIIIGICISFLISKSYRSNFQFFEILKNWKLGLSFLGGIIPFTAYALYQHIAVYGADQQLMTGNGLFTFEYAPLLDGFVQVLRDAFINADSWYMPYQGEPFFEIPLLPLAVLGLLMFWRGRWPWYTYGVFVSIPICIIMTPFAGPYPGMRRAIFVLLPYYIAVGGGFIYLLSAVADQEINKLVNNNFKYVLRKPLVLSLIVLAVVQPLAYQFTTGRDVTRWNFGEGFSKPPIPFNLILKTLKTNDIALDEKEFGGYFDDLIYMHYPRLYSRYNPEATIDHRVVVIRNLYDFSSSRSVAQIENKVLMGWDAREFGRLATAGKICMLRESLSSDQADYPYWSVVSTPGNSACKNSVDFSAKLGSEMSMAFDRIARLRHQLHCETANCGPDRPAFVNTNGGKVSFLLTPKSLDKISILRLNVTNPDKNRESLVFVNDVYLGSLTLASLSKGGKFAEFPIPQQVAAPENWKIQIGPSPANPNTPGWDIVSAEILEEGAMLDAIAKQAAAEAGKSYTYKELGIVRKPGTKWDDGTIIFDTRGISIAFDNLRNANSLDISFDNNDEYAVLFFYEKTLITTVVVKGVNHVDGLEVATVPLPKILASKQFNRAQIVPVVGDGYYSIGHFLLN
jgi:hypothetical protein